MKLHLRTTLLFTVLINFVFAQKDIKAPKIPVSEETKLFTYTKTVETPGVVKAELYDRAFAWLSAYYKNPADVLREKDREAGMMLLKARFKILNMVDKKSGVATAAGDVQYTLKLDFKDDKFRYTLTDINWKQLSYFPSEKWMDKTNQYYSPNWDYYLMQTDDNCKKIVADLEKAISTAKVEKTDKW
ncbi:MAG: DUF4468 domain-containing protein [Bacteroidia bacterium]